MNKHIKQLLAAALLGVMLTGCQMNPAETTEPVDTTPTGTEVTYPYDFTSEDFF